MALARTLEQRLAEITALRDDPRSPAARKAFRAALRSTTGVLVAAAVSVVAEHDLDELHDELAPAFSRLLERPVQRDPGCRGKVAIARALHDLDQWEVDVFVPGARHVQREPVWGGSEDTAAELRGICGYAFAHAGHPDALRVLAELLADPERAARAAAARALADTGHIDVEALLRYKVLVGDSEPEVLGACFAALLSLDADAALPFVRRFLDSADAAVTEAAVLALGESRLDAAHPVLARWCEDTMLDDHQRIGYLALALLRVDAANDTLLDVVRTASPPRAIHALNALATFRADAALCERALAAADNADSSVRSEAHTLFDRDEVP